MENLKKEQGLSYEIKKVFNNNVILAKTDLRDEELILVGKGLGFGKEAGTVLNLKKSQIEKEFIAAKNKQEKKYQQLIKTVDDEVIGLTEEIIAMLSSELDEKLDEHIHIALADHIGFYLKRIKEGLEVINPFLSETKTLYNEEYKLAEKAAKMIEDRFKVDIPEGEIGFITLHIHGARSKRGVSRTLKYTKLISEMVGIIKDRLKIELSADSLNYARLVAHLRFALERMELGEENENPLLEKIREDFKESYRLANELAQLIEQRVNLKAAEDEKGYLAMHLERLKKNLVD